MKTSCLIIIIALIFNQGCTPVNDEVRSSDLENEILRLEHLNLTDQTQLKNEYFFLKNHSMLNQLKMDYTDNKSEAISYIENLERIAENIFSSQIPTVTVGKKVSSASINDYVSIGIYWWPNPDTNDGLPYLRRDGHRNPEIKEYNIDELSTFGYNLDVLSILYFVTDNNKYASKGIEYLNSWFINNTTKMNPHMKFAQGIPGVTFGRFTGLIEGIEFIQILDSILLLKNSKYWNQNLESNLHSWYLEFFKWYNNSGQGKTADNYTNNHSTWYDLQLCSFAIAVGRNDVAEIVLDSVLSKRVNTQIEMNGYQVNEGNRTNGLHYSSFNLKALVALAHLGNYYNVDIWESNKGSNSLIIKAIDYILPYLLKQDVWPSQSLDDYNACELRSTLNIAFENTGHDDYRQAVNQINKLYSCNVYF